MLFLLFFKWKSSIEHFSSNKCGEEPEKRVRGMKLIRKPKLIAIVPAEKEKPVKEVKAEKTAKKAKMPPDTYKDEIPPKEMMIDETRKLVISVKRSGDLGLPHVDIRQFVTTEVYQGFTKKGVNFPLELIRELIEILQQADDECEEKGI